MAAIRSTGQIATAITHSLLMLLSLLGAGLYFSDMQEVLGVSTSGAVIVMAIVAMFASWHRLYRAHRQFAAERTQYEGEISELKDLLSTTNAPTRSEIHRLEIAREQLQYLADLGDRKRGVVTNSWDTFREFDGLCRAHLRHMLRHEAGNKLYNHSYKRRQESKYVDQSDIDATLQEACIWLRTAAKRVVLEDLRAEFRYGEVPVAPPPH